MSDARPSYGALLSLAVFSLLGIPMTGCSGGGAGTSAIPAAPAGGPDATVPAGKHHGGGGSSTIVLQAYDTSGNHLTWSAFRKLQENGNGSNGDNDTLLDPTSLRVTTQWPLQSTGGTSGDPSLQLPATPSSLALAWPTSDGYSNLIIDLPTTGGTYIFDELAAAQVVKDLDKAVAARPWYVPSAAFTAASATAHSELASSQAPTLTSNTASVGKMSAQALDAAVHAEILMLKESGIQYARAHHGSSGAPEWGVTLDTISGGMTNLQGFANAMMPGCGDGWIRIVFDKGEPASYYANEVANAHKLGLHVVGQLLDSSYMKSVSLGAFESRVQSYVATLPSVDEWEVGNEVNGDWLGANVAQKVAYAASYVKAHTSARTLVTLYWQLGEDTATYSMFNWAGANLNASILADVDDIGISLYPEQAPMGSAFDRVMNTLHAQFPNQKLMITELDYWDSDTGHMWWFGSQADPTTSGRIDVLDYYQSAIMSYPFTNGGTFWWYFAEEGQQGGLVWNALQSLHSSVDP